MWNGEKSHHKASAITAGTIQSEVSEAERPNARRNKRTRGPAPRHAQLGQVQRQILFWLLARQQGIVTQGSELERAQFERHGTAWVGAAKRIGVSDSAASRALRGPQYRSLLNRRLVKVKLSSGVWKAGTSLSPSDRVVGVRLTSEGEIAARLVCPVTKQDLGKTVREGVTNLYVSKYGAIETWPNAVHKRFNAQLQEAIDAHVKVSGVFGQRLVRLTDVGVLTMLVEYF